MNNDALETIKSVTKEICEKHVVARMNLYTDVLLDNRLREIVKQELINLMKESESLFVARIADALIEKIKEKLVTE